MLWLLIERLNTLDIHSVISDQRSIIKSYQVSTNMSKEGILKGKRVNVSDSI